MVVKCRAAYNGALILGVEMLVCRRTSTNWHELSGCYVLTQLHPRGFTAVLLSSGVPETEAVVLEHR